MSGEGLATEKYVRFVSRGELYAFPLLEVREVVVPGPLSRIPKAPRGALGVMNHHGAVIPVVDLAALQGGGDPRPPSLVLLLDHDRRRLGVGVEAVEGIGALAVQGGLGRLDDRAVTLLDRASVFEQVDLAFSDGTVLNG